MPDAAEKRRGCLSKLGWGLLLLAPLLYFEAQLLSMAGSNAPYPDQMYHVWAGRACLAGSIACVLAFVGLQLKYGKPQ